MFCPKRPAHSLGEMLLAVALAWFVASGCSSSDEAAPTPTPAPSEVTCSKNSARFVTHVVDHEFGPGQTAGQDDFPALVLGPPEGAGCCNGATSGIVSLGNGGWIIAGFEDNVFAELATVAVSDDGEHWAEFPCSASESPYGQCAGWHPTLANAAENEIDPLNPAVAGGDAFDLADVGLAQARYVRITDRPDLDAGLDGVFDLDAVSVVHAACPDASE